MVVVEKDGFSRVFLNRASRTQSQTPSSPSHPGTRNAPPEVHPICRFGGFRQRWEAFFLLHSMDAYHNLGWLKRGSNNISTIRYTDIECCFFVGFLVDRVAPGRLAP